MNAAVKTQAVGLSNLGFGDSANGQDGDVQMGLAGPIGETANPFVSLSSRFPAHAAVVASAFAIAHQVDDVYAALRMHRKCGGQDLTGYLMGKHFYGWYQGVNRDIPEDLLPELRDMAHEFLEGGV